MTWFMRFFDNYIGGNVPYGEHRQAPAQDNGGSASGGAGGSGPDIAVTPGGFTYNAYTSPAQSPLGSQQGLGQPGLAPHQLQHAQMVQQLLAAQGTVWTSSAVGPSIGVGMLPTTSFAPRPKLENGGIQVGEIIAWRWWLVVYGGYLKSCTNATVWPTTEPLKASAAPDGTGPGIYAFRTAQDAINDRAGMILGRVMLWGTVVEYERGYTAEYAKIVSLDRAQDGWGDLPHLRTLYGLPQDGSLLKTPLIVNRTKP